MLLLPACGNTAVRVSPLPRLQVGGEAVRWGRGENSQPAVTGSEGAERSPRIGLMGGFSGVKFC